MIELKNVSKTFQIENQQVAAVKDVNLQIAQQDIFGVIGFSGAGKSTLVRLINLLERPTSGSVHVNGIDMLSLDAKALREERKKIGMIFQQFNLFASRTVFDNVAFPLKNKIKAEIQARVTELLELVGISDKANAYPSQLSGGQKQRVAIARALANNPAVLLCDEATSALDPQTTDQILQLLQFLNRELKITIVIITHEMRIVKEICNKVAVMDSGVVVETGDVVEVFAHPKQEITRNFIGTTSNLAKINDLIANKAELVALEKGQKLIRLNFFGQVTGEPLIAELAKRFSVTASVIFGNVEVLQEISIGSLIVIFSGEENKQEEALFYLREQKVEVEVIKNA